MTQSGRSLDARTVCIHPVIHVESAAQVVADLTRICDADIAGVFLIDHDANNDRLAESLSAAHKLDTGVPLGVNVMRRSARESLEVLASRLDDLSIVDALWVDTVGLETGRSAAMHTAYLEAQHAYHWSGRLFGGIAFKHQAAVADHELAALAAQAPSLCDVPTTSGAATGSGPSIRKLQIIRQGLPTGALAVASGVTPGNLRTFTPYLSDVLVSTGISGDDGRISRERLDDLVRAAEGPSS